MQQLQGDVSAGYQKHTTSINSQISNDVASDEVTASFVRKVLCSHQSHVASEGRAEASPIEELLPPLTSSNAVDLQLYAFISILIKEYVYTWYTKISPDHVFVSEVVQIIAHCTRSLEERARTIDFESLILDDLAGLLEAHVQAQHVANQAAKTPEPSSNARLIYHTIRPHPALKIDSQVREGEGRVEEDPISYSAYRQLLSQSLLAVLLPTEDLQNPCLRALVAEVVADLILGNFIGNRICSGIFIYDTICKASNVARVRFNIQTWATDKSRAPPSRLTRFGLLTTQSPSTSITNRTTFSLLFSLIWRYVPLALAFLRLLLQIMVASAFLRPRGRSAKSSAAVPSKDKSKASMEQLQPHEDPQTVKIDAHHGSPPKPFLEYRIWPATATLTHFVAKMPWLTALLSLIQYLLLFGPLELGKANSRLDRIIAHHVVSPLFPLSKHLPTILLNLRLALFPGNALPPRSEIPPHDSQNSDATSDETIATSASKRAAAFAILNLIPQPMARVYFAVPSHSSAFASSVSETVTESAGTGRQLSREEEEIEFMVKGMEEILDAFSDEYMNRHLAFAVVERVLVALVPELAEGKTVAELLADRGVDPGLNFDLDSTANQSGGKGGLS